VALLVWGSVLLLGTQPYVSHLDHH
jgi:hypothetical protein